ncbi:sugar ABC transporter ATP-binding protein [Pararhodobacter sp.]|uniref:sugar ABC transporter ATP-binding protein n=1 Tax=Pararhodobacter sp. TaxID=2127056 RepID=UPI002FDDBA6C
MTDTGCLTLEGVSRRYGPVQALDDVHLTLRAGEVHALMGENGAGKSTLIRLIAGLEAPDSGGMRLNGAPVRIASASAAQAAGLRFLHQELHVVPSLSVAENMHLSLPYPRRLGLVDWRVLNRAARGALDRLRVDHIDPRQPMSRLGPGDQMLVRIAATLLGADRPWLYVMDEPTAALTGAESERLFAVIGELTGAGAGVLYVSHRMAEVTRLARRVTVLRDGKVVSCHPMQDTDQTTIIHDMTGRDLSELFPPRIAQPKAEPVLRVRGLHCAGLSDIDLDLAPGEVLAIAGLAGSGRGALLRALIGAIPRAGGAITLNGRDPGRSPAETWAAGMAYVPRERRAEGLMIHRPIAENVALPHLSALARAGVLVNRRAEAALVREQGGRVRLRAASHRQHCDHLSGGNQQKVLFARAIAGRPRVLLLDEPTRGVDIGAKYEIYRLIRELGAAGMGVILTSSDLTEVLGLADRIAVLQEGRLARLVDNTALSEAQLLTLCYPEMP